MNFDQIINRKNTYSMKWDGAQSIYQNSNLIPMWIADMDLKAPEPIISAIRKYAELGIYGYVEYPELTDIPQVIAEWLKKRNNWNVKPENLGYSSGVINGISLAIRALTQENDSIIVQSPLYGHFRSAIEHSKRVLVKNDLIRQEKSYFFNWDKLESQIVANHVKMAILCNPHNPTGRVWSPDELRHFVNICQQHQVIILSDDIHSDLILPGYQYYPVASICPEYSNQIITFKSLSKTFNVAGLQFSYYHTTNNTYLKKMKSTAQYSSNPEWPTSFALPALKAAYENPICEKWLQRLLVYLASNLQWLTKEIESKTPAIVTHSQSTYLAWIDVSYLHCSEADLLHELDNSGIGIQSNKDFGLNNNDGLFIRLNYATSKAVLKQGIQRLINGLNHLHKK